MEQFVVSARKYRPKRFTDVVGQQGVTITLRNALKSGHLAQSFLFCGPRGVGKTTCARILAKAINCLNPTTEFEPCGQCDSCKSFEQNTSFNIHELDAASNNSVEDIRELVSQVRVPPQAGKYKVYIIDEVHMLSQAAFNAFLKTLEEPPSYAIFILATTEKHKIIPTILSRCQIYEFSRITVQDVVLHLQGIATTENITADANALNIIGQKADGALRDALSMFDRLVNHVTNQLTLDSVLTNLNILDYEYYFRFTDYMLTQDLAGVLLLFDDVQRKGFEGDLLITGLCEHFRNLLVCKDTNTANLLEVSGSLRERYLNQANNTPASFLLNAMNLANQAEISYKTSKNKRLHVELALMKMTQLSNLLTLASTGNIPEVKKNSDSVVTTVSNPTAIIKEKEVEKLPASEAYKIIEEPSVATPIHAENTSASREESILKRTEAAQTVVSEAKPELSKPRKSLSLSNISLGKLEENLQKAKEDNTTSDSLFQVQKIPAEILITNWNNFAKLLSEEKPHIASISKSNQPIDADGTIKVVVNTLVQKNQFEESKQDFLDYLKQEHDLRASFIVELVKDAEDGPIKKAFTKDEKLELMIQKNPDVLTLLQELDLK
jgi:DNA polymerase III subunit gamma/tau